MFNAAEIEEHWRKRCSINSNLTTRGGLSARSISRDWANSLSFEGMVANDEDLSERQKKELLQHEGVLIPTTATLGVWRHRHPKGYHFYSKHSPRPVEEYVFSQFAHACGFPYAPTLPSVRDPQKLYVPKLGDGVSSLFSMMVKKIAREGEAVAPSLREHFARAVQKFGSPQKITYRYLLGEDRAAEKEFVDLCTPIIDKNKVFLSKLIALRALGGACDEILNPTNIICSSHNIENFVYAIDNDPAVCDEFIDGYSVPRFHRPDIVLSHSWQDADIVRGMQRIMRERITDDVVDTVMERAKFLITQPYAEYKDTQSFDIQMRRINAMAKETKFRLSNPALVTHEGP